jgi:molybdate transport system ATP-binding protein
MTRIAVDIALRRGDFELAAKFESTAGGVTAIAGPSGAGKTSLLRTIAGLERPTRGTLSVGDVCWGDIAANLWVAAQDRRAGYVTQDSSLFPHLSVRGNLEYGLRRLGRADRRIGLPETIDALGLEGLLDRSTRDLSGGERQRISIGRALLRSPALLLLDEPVSALDLVGRREVLDHLLRVRERLAVRTLLVSHDLREAAGLADEMLWMEGGRIVAQGPAREVLTDLRLPFASLDDAESVLDASVVGHDDEVHLTQLTCAGGDLWVMRQDATSGTGLHVQIAARDVSLATRCPEHSSVLNVLAGRVESLAPAQGEPAHVLVRVDIGGQALLARITLKSSRALALSGGTAVWAFVKSVAILS